MHFDGTEEQLEILREIADNLTDAVFLVDRSRNVWYHNRAFEAAVGVRMRSKRYKALKCSELLGLKICPNECVMAEALQTEAPARVVEIEGNTAGGERRVFHINAIPLIGSTGNAIGALVFLRDDTAEADMHAKYKGLIERNSAISLSGRIEEGNLPDVIQLFSFLQKTGTLSLRRGEETGVITFERGKIVFVSMGVTRGVKAVGRLLAWTDAAFAFEPSATVEPPERLEMSSDFLLMDALREKDELNQLQTQSTPLVAEARPRADRILSEEELGELEWRLYEFVLQGFSLQQMLDASPETDAACCMALHRLQQDGAVSW